jgi:type VI secretion system protein ImpM
LSAGPALGLRLGFYGKIPSRGDFVRHGLSRALISCWDGWLQSVLASTPLGEDLAAIWDAAPVWRLALDAGLCGPAPLLGVMLPSADRSGRRFPLLCAAEGTLDLAGASRLIDLLQEIGRIAVETASGPEEIRTRLAVVSLPEPAGTRVVAAAAGRGRWWHDAAGALTLPGMPDAATFLRMLQPAPTVWNEAPVRG